jgi:hypothetical protein
MSINILENKLYEASDLISEIKKKSFEADEILDSGIKKIEKIIYQLDSRLNVKGCGVEELIKEIKEIRTK